MAALPRVSNITHEIAEHGEEAKNTGHYKGRAKKDRHIAFRSSAPG
jgi:hypothetical protein